MGTAESKPTPEPEMSRLSPFRRSSKGAKSTKADQMQVKADTISNLKREIDMFAGNRSDTRYKDFTEILAKTAKDLEMIRRRTSKQYNRDRCDQILGDVQNCLQRLETRISFNEQTNLDSAAVESHSFINHNFNQRPPPPDLIEQDQVKTHLKAVGKQTRQPKNEIKSLDYLEQQTDNLERETKMAIDLQDTKQLVILENKVKIIYADLVMLKIDDHTPLSVRKEAIEQRLYKCNNQIMKMHRKLAKSATSSPPTSSRDGSALSKPPKMETDSNKKQLDTIAKVEMQLSELEVQALTFEGYKGDKKYNQLEQILENNWTKLYSADVIGSEERDRRSAAVEHAKTILQELRKRAEENEDQAKALQNLRKIEEEIQALQKNAGRFGGTTDDPRYTKLDQEARKLWAQLSEVKEPNEHVRRSKARVITEVQDMLKNLSRDTKKRESQIQEDISQTQLVKQAKEFQNHWEQLNHNLGENRYLGSDTSNAIVEILDKVVDGLRKRTAAISNAEKRKSNTSLVKVKLYDNSESQIKYHTGNVEAIPKSTSMSDIYQNPQSLVLSDTSKNMSQQSKSKSSINLSQSAQSEIKAQPAVKAISEMQRIGNEAKTILQQMRQSSFTKQDAEYTGFEIRLKECKANLDSLEYNRKSETLESNRRRASKMISEAFRALEEKKVTRSTGEAAIRYSRAQELMDIDAEMQYWHQQIRNFDGVTKDKQYEKIKNGLSESLRKLQVIEDVQVPKQDSIRQIQQYHQELETKLAENQAKVKIQAQNVELRKQTANMIRALIEQVQKLKARMDKFSGAYRGLVYNQIEKELTDCHDRMSGIDSRGDEKLENAKAQTQQKIKKYLRILEDKATKSSMIEGGQEEQQQVNGVAVEENLTYQRVYTDSMDRKHTQNVEVAPQTEKQNGIVDAPQSEEQQAVVRRPKKSTQEQSQRQSESPHVLMNALRDKLVVIQEETRTFSGNYKDTEYAKIERELVECMDELNGIADAGHQSILISKEQYADYILKLLQYFEEKTGAPKEEEQATDRNSQRFVVADPMEELDKIDRELDQFKSKLEGSSRASTADLGEELRNCILRVEMIEVGNVAHVRDRQRKLLRELQNYEQLANEKEKRQSQVSEGKIEEHIKKIETILKDLSELGAEIRKFKGLKNDREYSYLDESLIRTMIQLDNVDAFGSDQIKDIRREAIQEVQRYMKTLTDLAEKNQGNIDSISSTV